MYWQIDGLRKAWKMPKKSCLRWYYDKQHGKWSQTLSKSAQQHPYDIY